ncbi:MAG: hypothetical protein KDC41_14560, partial [Saprospiraceae bacterium]|nr:hypothetical protein [Saprospiraceae bacterium]
EAAFSEKDGQRYTGFIAQEVEEAAREVGYDFSGVDAPDNPDDIYGLRYAEFNVPLVKAVQELDRLAKEQQEDLDRQQTSIDQAWEAVRSHQHTLTELQEEVRTKQ